ncbi:MAG TPA: FAD-dependent monooxygenase [Mycobacteriales bacterium]|jgi:2-polyprenyl-6-methoxyphenol hydroxylase-like FAD-dependent oxidoreductase|nr:FAD-dependent monooxygenase [Mycobacteriales bacterium]
MDPHAQGAANLRIGRPQVLVVGAGPAGLVAGIALARQDIDVLVVDRRPEASTLSRALVISTRTMELLRSWGVEEQVRAGAADVEPRAWVTRTLASGGGTEMPLGYPSAAEAALVSPTRPAWAPQDHLEPILLALLRSSPTAAVRFGLELIGLEQDERNAHAVLRERESGRIQRIDVQYVVGADGARSTVRSHLGIPMDGPDNLGEYQRVEFHAALGDVVGKRRYGLYVITHPDAGGVLAPRGNSGRWGFSREWHPGERSLSDYEPDQLISLIGTAVGVPEPRPDIERTSSFSIAAQLADRYREGRCFLVGDAAHRMTPRGGTGLNTAVQDAYALGWKLGWVLRGWARPELLDSYETERRPIGEHNVGRTGAPDGAKRASTEALPWDLNGRLTHHWINQADPPISTLDLLGPGLTLFTGPGWAGAVNGVDVRPPVTRHSLDAAATSALQLEPAGAVLVGPDAQPLARWAGPTEPLHADALPAIAG